MAKFIQYAMMATQEALSDAKWFPTEKHERERTGVSVGSGIGGIEDITEASIHMHNQVRESECIKSCKS
jgi:3-oxoacyl-[acyl-carrier-protein] synthase II